MKKSEEEIEKETATNQLVENESYRQPQEGADFSLEVGSIECPHSEEINSLEGKLYCHSVQKQIDTYYICLLLSEVSLHNF